MIPTMALLVPTPYPTSVFKYKSIVDTLDCLPEAYRVNIDNPRQSVQLEEIEKILIRENVKTVVAEEYVDRHFIHDFCGHYGACYYDYPKKCIRLHFFSNEFSPETFKKYVVEGLGHDNALGEYAGFIILRPIPGAVLSNVSLSIITNSHSELVIKKKRDVHLCGLDLQIETIPFTEQDHAISACATSALWMALQAVPGNQPHNVPSPYKLTTNAHKVLVEGIKSHVVSRGLTISQMAFAIKEENLNPLACIPHSMSYAKALLKAYLNMGVPIVLGIELYYRSDAAAKHASSRRIGFHSVTALGYSCGEEVDVFDAPEMASQGNDDVPDLYLESSAVNVLYCHDDQIGPYTKMSIPDEYSTSLTTEWGRIYAHGPVDAKIISVLVPCNVKVRIRFSKIYEIVKALNADLSPYYNLFGGHLSWDIRLGNVCDFKKDLRKLNSLGSDVRYKLLAMSMPRYLWVVDQFYNINESKELITTFLFDATDIENSNFLIRVIHYGEFSYALTLSVANNQLSHKSKQNSPEVVRRLMDLYRKGTQEAANELDEKIVLAKS